MEVLKAKEGYTKYQYTSDILHIHNKLNYYNRYPKLN